MVKEEQRKQIGQRIGAKLEQLGRKQVWLAVKLRRTEPHVTKLIKTGSVSLWTLIEICGLLKCSMDEIVFGEAAELPKSGEHLIQELLEELESAMAIAQVRIDPKRKAELLIKLYQIAKTDNARPGRAVILEFVRRAAT